MCSITARLSPDHLVLVRIKPRLVTYVTVLEINVLNYVDFSTLFSVFLTRWPNTGRESLNVLNLA